MSFKIILCYNVLGFFLVFSSFELWNSTSGTGNPHGILSSIDSLFLEISWNLIPAAALPANLTLIFDIGEFQISDNKYLVVSAVVI